MILMFIMVIKSWITPPKNGCLRFARHFLFGLHQIQMALRRTPKWFPPDEDGVTKSLGFEGLAQVEVDIFKGY